VIPAEELVKLILVRFLRPLLASTTYTVRHGLAKGLKRKGGLGFFPFPSSLSKEERCLVGLNLSGATVYDVGGYEGIYTIFFARAVGVTGKVVTYEPNPINQDKIRKNIAVNNFHNVYLRPIGLGRARQREKLAYFASDPGTGSVEPRIKSKILQGGAADIVEVEIDSLDNEIVSQGLPKPDFIKVDVEGLEVDVLQGMSETLRKYKPALFIEMHGVDDPAKGENAHKVINILTDYKYTFHHVESGKTVTLENVFDAMRGHIYCSGFS